MQKRKKNKKLPILLAFSILIISITYISYYKYKEKLVYENHTKVLDTITQVVKLNTVKYNYSNIVTVKKDKSVNNIKIPFTEKSFIIKYNGIINGGIDLEDVKIVKDTGNEIYIEIKNCKILDHYIDDKNMYVYDVKTSIFNKLEVQEVLNDISKYKNEYEERVISEGFMEEIKTKTKISLEIVLKKLGYEEIHITFAG